MAEAQLDEEGFEEAGDTEMIMKIADRLAEIAQTDDRLTYLLKVCDANPTAEEVAEYQRYYDNVEATLETDEAARTPVQLQSDNVVNFTRQRDLSRIPIEAADSRFGDIGRAGTSGPSFDNYRKRKADFDSPPNRARARTEENDPFTKYEPAVPSQQANSGNEAREIPVARRSTSPLFVVDSREPTPEACEPPVFDPGDPFAVMRWKKQQKEKAAAKEAASKRAAPAADLDRMDSFAQAGKRKQEKLSQRAAHGSRLVATSTQTGPSQKARENERSPPDAPLSKKFEPSRDVLEKYRSGNPIPLANAKTVNALKANTSIPSRPALQSSSRKPSAFANTSRTGVHPVKRTSLGSTPGVPRAPTNKLGEPKTKAVDPILGKRQTGEAGTSKQSKVLAPPSNSRAEAMPPVRSHKKKHSEDVTPYKAQIKEQKDMIAEKGRHIESLQSDINQLRTDNRKLHKSARESEKRREVLEIIQLDLKEAQDEIRKLKFQVKMARVSRATDDNDSEAEAQEQEAERLARLDEERESELADLRKEVSALRDRLALKENPYPGYDFVHKNLLDTPLVGAKSNKHRKLHRRDKVSKHTGRKLPVVLVAGGGRHPAMRLDSDDGIADVSIEESTDDDDSVDIGSQSSDEATDEDAKRPLTKNEKQLLKFDQMVGLPKNPMATHISGMLAYRDGTRDANGRLPRAKEFFKVGRNVPGQLK